MEINTEVYDLSTDLSTNLSMEVENDPNSPMEVQDDQAPPDCENFSDNDEIFAANSDDYVSILAQFYGQMSDFQLVPAWLVILFLVIGFSGNIINVLVYTRPFMRSQISLLLVSLEVVNLFLYPTYIPDLLRHFHLDFGPSYAGVVLETFEPAVETAIVGFSNWLTVLIGIWRFVAIKFPLNVKKWCTVCRTKWAILIVALFNILVVSPQAFMHSFRRYVMLNVTYNNEYSEIVSLYTIIKSRYVCDYPNLVQVARGVILLTTNIPCFILAIVTVFLLVSLWAAKKKRSNLTSGNSTFYTTIPFNRQIESDAVKETKLTVLLVLLVFLYFLAYLPDSVNNIRFLRTTSPDSLRQEGFYKFVASKITILVCNASTFFIYYAMSARFREALHCMLIPTRFRNDQVKKSVVTMNSFTNS